MFADVFSSICYIQIMPNVNSEIENQKRSIERLRAELTSLYRELGEVACSWHEAISYEPSNEDKYVAQTHNFCAIKRTSIDKM